jgi:5'-3' exonuclease
MSARLINIYSPNRFVACLEGDWRPSWRVDLFPEYKLNRIDESGDEAEPDTLSPQIPVLLDVLDAFGFATLGVDDYEADDVIATLSKSEHGPIRIASGDRDLFQLVDDEKDVKIAYLAKGLSNHDLVDIDWISKKYEIPGDRYALFAMIRGDASDGLPGLKGIGEKGAALIAKCFSQMQDVVKAAENEDELLPKTLAKKVLASKEYARIAPKLVNCALDVPIPSMNIDLPKKPNSLTNIKELQSEYGLGSSVDRLLSALRWD